MTVFIGRPRWDTMIINADTGYGFQPALGITYDMVSVTVSKDGNDFVEKIVTEDGWKDLGGGYYSLLYTEADLDTVGELFAIIDIPSLGVGVWDNFDVDPVPFHLDNDSPVCVVSGSIVDIGGESQPTGIDFRPRTIPVIAGRSLVSANLIHTTTDAYGNFSVKLLRRAKVLVEIESAGIRYLIDVPDLPSASLIDLLPPIPLEVP